MYTNIKSVFSYALYLITDYKKKRENKRLLKNVVLDDRVTSSEYIDKDRFI